jgi:hypothetical protein
LQQARRQLLAGLDSNFAGVGVDHVGGRLLTLDLSGWNGIRQPSPSRL